MTQSQPPVVAPEHGDADAPVWKPVLMMVAALVVIGALLMVLSIAAARVFG